MGVKVGARKQKTLILDFQGCQRSSPVKEIFEPWKALKRRTFSNREKPARELLGLFTPLTPCWSSSQVRWSLVRRMWTETLIVKKN